MAVFRPSMLVLFTNVGSKSPWGIRVSWQVDAAFSSDELLVDVRTCTKVMVDTQCGAGIMVPSPYEMPWVLAPAVSLGRGGVRYT